MCRDDLWRVYNTVQENLIRGGMQTRSASVSFCGDCGERLSWERTSGQVREVWLGSCTCGLLRVLHICFPEEGR